MDGGPGGIVEHLLHNQSINIRVRNHPLSV